MADGLTGRESLEKALASAHESGLRHVHMLAWRDLDDPEAGGSELHAHRIASLWSEGGIDVTLRTSAVPGQPVHVRRGGYRVVRRAGRYSVFPRSVANGLLGRIGATDGLVEVWNGMPFFSPLWARGAHVVFVHHVHAEMWNMVLPPSLARLGRFVEGRMAPPIYRRSHVVTLSESSRQEILDAFRLPPANVRVVPPGVDWKFSPGGERSSDPLIVAVGRLVPVKRFDRLLGAVAKIAARHPRLQVVVVGEGYERPALERLRRDLGLDRVVRFPGRSSDSELIALYRRAWFVVSTSQREGWGMTLTEAAACGTPAVATDIAGHRDAVAHRSSGLLVADMSDLPDALETLLGDPDLRMRLSRGAVEHAAGFTWEATAAGALSVLVDQVNLSRRRA